MIPSKLSVFFVSTQYMCWYIKRVKPMTQLYSLAIHNEGHNGNILTQQFSLNFTHFIFKKVNFSIFYQRNLQFFSHFRKQSWCCQCQCSLESRLDLNLSRSLRDGSCRCFIISDQTWKKFKNLLKQLHMYILHIAIF